MRSCVTGEGGEKGGERPGARERERAASEEGGREAGPPTWGALARSQLACRGRESPGEADKCGHIGRRGARRGAHGPRRLRPAEAVFLDSLCCPTELFVYSYAKTRLSRWR